MIYNDKFVWLHFPKCAGTKIENLFRAYLSDQADVHQDPVGLKLDPTIAWHDTIADRQARDSSFVLGDRAVICSFRKLPSWLESRYNFEVQRNPKLSHQPELLLEGKFLESDGFVNHADQYARRYLPPEIVQNSKVRFIRTEHFKEDFKKVFGDYVDLSAVPDKAFNKKVNSSRRYLSYWLKRKLYGSKQGVYEKCPYWKQLDEMAY